MKTFIKWSGNKTQHLSKIIKFVPQNFNTYIEPFVGSGAMFLKLQPSRWIINDVNKDLINIWRHVGSHKLEEHIISNFKQFSKTFKKMNQENQVNLCRQITEKITNLPYSHERAAAYMLMTMCSYNGNLLIKDKLYFGGLNMHITKRNKYYFLDENIIQT
jgi:DNA adenine methylase